MYGKLPYMSNSINDDFRSQDRSQASSWTIPCWRHEGPPARHQVDRASLHFFHVLEYLQE